MLLKMFGEGELENFNPNEVWTVSEIQNLQNEAEKLDFGEFSHYIENRVLFEHAQICVCH